MSFMNKLFELNFDEHLKNFYNQYKQPAVVEIERS